MSAACGIHCATERDATRPFPAFPHTPATGRRRPVARDPLPGTMGDAMESREIRETAGVLSGWPRRRLFVHSGPHGGIRGGEAVQARVRGPTGRGGFQKDRSSPHRRPARLLSPRGARCTWAAAAARGPSRTTGASRSSSTGTLRGSPTSAATLDSHNNFQIFFPWFWVDSHGEPLSPHTLITVGRTRRQAADQHRPLGKTSSRRTSPPTRP